MNRLGLLAVSLVSTAALLVPGRVDAAPAGGDDARAIALPTVSATGSARHAGPSAPAGERRGVTPRGALTPTRVGLASLVHRVVVDGEVVAHGYVSGEPHRAVILQFRTARGWHSTSARAHTDRRGSYRVTVPTDWFGTHVLRVKVAASRTHAAGTSETARIAVKPAYTPAGAAKAWAPLVPGTRWNPCSTIPFRVNPAGAPDGSLATVQEAFHRMHQATGLRFRYAGTSSLIPFSRGEDDLSQFPKQGLVVAWATPDQVSGLAGDVAGLGGSAYRITTRDGHVVKKQYIRGGVAVDETAGLPHSGFEDGASLGALLMHEIGHTMGLDHTQDLDQVMYPDLRDSTKARYGAGDLAGLRALGASRGCL